MEDIVANLYVAFACQFNYQPVNAVVLNRVGYVVGLNLHIVEGEGQALGVVRNACAGVLLAAEAAGGALEHAVHISAVELMVADVEGIVYPLHVAANPGALVKVGVLGNGATAIHRILLFIEPRISAVQPHAVAKLEGLGLTYVGCLTGKLIERTAAGGLPDEQVRSTPSPEAVSLALECMRTSRALQREGMLVVAVIQSESSRLSGGDIEVARAADGEVFVSPDAVVVGSDVVGAYHVNSHALALHCYAAGGDSMVVALPHDRGIGEGESLGGGHILHAHRAAGDVGAAHVDRAIRPGYVQLLAGHVYGQLFLDGHKCHSALGRRTAVLRYLFVRFIEVAARQIVETVYIAEVHVVEL